MFDELGQLIQQAGITTVEQLAEFLADMGIEVDPGMEGQAATPAVGQNITWNGPRVAPPAPSAPVAGQQPGPAAAAQAPPPAPMMAAPPAPGTIDPAQTMQTDPLLRAFGSIAPPMYTPPPASGAPNPAPRGFTPTNNLLQLLASVISNPQAPTPLRF